jgi:hypothetical protein
MPSIGPTLPAMLIALGLASCSRDLERAQAAYTPSGARLHWRAKEIVLTPAPERRGERPFELLSPALIAAASAWNQALAGCKAPRLLVNRTLLSGPLLGDDRVNAVIVHERKWCPTTSVQPEHCYPADSQAHTLLYPSIEPGSPKDGELRGIDIEVNAVDYQWSVREAKSSLSLQTIFMHELGHVLGLDHPCGPNTQWSNKKRPLIACAPNAPLRIMRSDIASVTQGDSASPSQAEVDAVCELYR